MFILLLLFLIWMIKKLKSGRIEIETPNIPMIKIRPNPQLVSSARIAYIEISNRKIALDFSEENDAISEIYNSFYSCLQILRDVLKNLSQNGEEGKLFKYLSEFINKVLRYHLEKFQSKYRAWLDIEKKKLKYVDENTAQKKYQYYNDIVLGIQAINTEATELLICLAKVAYNTKSKKEKRND